MFVSHKLSLRPKSLRLVLSKTKNLEKQEGRETIKDLIEAVKTVMKTNDQEDNLYVEERTVQDALKILPIFQKESKKLQKKSSKESDRSLSSLKKAKPGMMEIESVYKVMNQEDDDLISKEVRNTLIILSNFGELPNYSFGNVKRELVINHGEKRRGINVEDQVVIASDIELYHRMRYLLSTSGRYAFNHDPGDKYGKTILSEIGSLTGKKGDFKIFGLLYKDGKK